MIIRLKRCNILFFFWVGGGGETSEVAFYT